MVVGTSKTIKVIAMMIMMTSSFFQRAVVLETCLAESPLTAVEGASNWISINDMNSKHLFVRTLETALGCSKNN